MKSKVLLLVLMLMAMCVTLIASEDGSDPEEYFRKTKELDKMANKFKAETGFQGSIEYGYEQMILGSFEGNFSDIQYSSDGDTIAYRQACEKVLNKILPYSNAFRSQLSMSKIRSQRGLISTDYYQQVNGYRVEGLGFIIIDYDLERKRFYIGKATVELPEGDVEIKISKDEAIQIAYTHYITTEYYNNKTPIAMNRVSLLWAPKIFVDYVRRDYNLYWIVAYPDLTHYIDVRTGELFCRSYAVNKEVTYTIFGNKYGTGVGFASEGMKPMFDLHVESSGIEKFTNELGEVAFDDSTASQYQVTYLTQRGLGIRNVNSASTLSEVSSSLFNTLHLSDALVINNDTSLYAPNIVHHIQDQDLLFSKLSNDYRTYSLPVVNNDWYDPDILGKFEPSTYSISVRNGLNSHTIRHELSHYFSYLMMGLHQFYERLGGGTSPDDMRYQSMDEAFAEYFLSVGINSTCHDYGLIDDLQFIDVSDVFNSYNSTISTLPLNESFYSWYYCRYPLASAWWSLRNNTSIGTTQNGVNPVDAILLEALGRVRRELDFNQSYRYKPRYFYNILMSQAATDTVNWTLNPKQKAIESAYSSRGLHFYPKVESISSAGSNQDKYKPGDEVHVKITKAPQNTRFNLYVVKHGVYNYVNGGAIPNTSCLASGFQLIPNTTTDINGEWSGLAWTIPSMLTDTHVDYDIIVDFGSPSAPDNVVTFAFKADKVMDGFDGRIAPGFKVIDNSFDIVFAMDCSSSMADSYGDLVRTARQLVGQLSDSDRVGVFAYAAILSSNAYNDYLRRMVPLNQYGLVSVGTNRESLCGDGPINLNYLPSNLATNMITPVYEGHNWFDTSNRPKHFVVMSDGWHCLTGVNYFDPQSHIHSLINSSYNPDIRCHTMRYAIPQQNIPDYPEWNYNPQRAAALMRNIASWGNGKSWAQTQLVNSYWDINGIIDQIRGSSSTVDNKGLFTNDYTIGDSISIQFTVDRDAYSLESNICIDFFDTGEYSIEFDLFSPSGLDVTDVNLNPGYYTYHTSQGRVVVPYPEEGLWTAVIKRPAQNLQVDSYSFSAKVESNLDVSIPELPFNHPINTPLPLTVKLMDYLSPVKEANVAVFLIRDDWSIKQRLYDDGLHNDGLANDGIYGAYLYGYGEALAAFPGDVGGMYELLYEIDIPSLSASRVKRGKIFMEVPEEFPLSAEGRLLKEGWRWIGFPRLQRDGTNDRIDCATISLGDAVTRVYSQNGSATHSNDIWEFNGLYGIDSKEGYKLRIQEDEVRLFEMGSLVDSTSAYPLYEGWNWITYPCYANAYPEEAFAGILENIDYVLAEKWSMRKDEEGNWKQDGLRKSVIRYGESLMVNLTCKDTTFVWNDSQQHIPVSYTAPLSTQYYKYEDKHEYETFMIDSIDGDPDFSEIAVYQDEYCIGARVKGLYPMQLLAYSKSIEDGGGEISFRLYDGSKGEIALIPVRSSKNDRQIDESLIYPEAYGFRSYSLKTNSDLVPSLLTLQKNYPNPFNPSTTIRFSIPKKGITKLIVYNIKGQKVRTLINDDLSFGFHEVVWNGRDDSNRAVSSGVYFARLEHSNQAKTRKMMLMK